MDVHKIVERYLIKDIYAKKFFDEICDMFDIILFGGCVRDIVYGHISNWRDLDIVLCNKVNVNNNLETIIIKLQRKIKNINIQKNRFNGYKIRFQQLIFDLWMLEDTWAFKEGILIPTRYNLLKSVYLNIDAYAYDWHNSFFLDDCNKKKIHIIDIELERSNNVLLNLIRAQVLGEKYGLPLSRRLLDKIEMERVKENYIEICEKIQLDHYGKIVLNLRR